MLANFGMGEHSVRAVVLELFGGDGGDASILDYICGVLEDEHFEWEDLYDSIGPFLVRRWGRNRCPCPCTPMRDPCMHAGMWRCGLPAAVHTRMRRGMAACVVASSAAHAAGCSICCTWTHLEGP